MWMNAIKPAPVLPLLIFLYFKSLPELVESMLFLVVRSTKIRFIPQNLDLFTACPDQPSNVLSIQDAFDFSDLNFEYIDIDNTLLLSGNATTRWDIEKTDRIQARFVVMKFDRGSWRTTPLALSVDDACKILYDKNQYWYQFWTEYITNADEVKDNCLNVPGTTFVHRDFIISFVANIPGYWIGLHKVVGHLKAIGPKNVERKNNICFEIIGEYESLS